MANNERLTKRVKVMEDWIAENKEIGGPNGTLDTFNFLVTEMRALAQQANNVTSQLEQFRAYCFEFIKEGDMVEDWDEFIKAKEEQQQGEQFPTVEKEAEKKSSKKNKKK